MTNHPVETNGIKEWFKAIVLSPIVGLIQIPAVSGLDLNSADAILVHQRIIQQKLFLRHFYKDMYTIFCEQAKALHSLPGKMLELGSGPGFLKDMLPEATTSDVCALPFIDRVISAYRLPYKDGELKAIFGLNLLHHLADPEAFFHESDRCLVKGGRLVLIEHYFSWWGRLFYRYFHREACTPQAAQWQAQDIGRLETANSALPWIIFERDRLLFEKRFPRLSIRSITPHTVTRYILSGGLSLRSLAPSFSYPFFRLLDNALSKAHRVFPIFQTIVIEKIA